MAAVNFEALAQAERRTWQAFFHDGLDDVFLGIGFLLMAAAATVPRGWRPIAWPAAVVALFALDRVLKAAKRRVSHRRTGFVRPPRPRAIFTNRRIVMLVVGGYLLGGLVGFNDQVLNPSLPLAPLVPFAMWVVVFLARAWKTGYARYYALSIVPGVAAAVAWPVEEGTLRDVPVLFGAIGLGLAVSGAWTLRSYLGENALAEGQG